MPRAKTKEEKEAMFERIKSILKKESLTIETIKQRVGCSHSMVVRAKRELRAEKASEAQDAVEEWQ